ncbi:MATE family efflux transporter [Tianweitania sp. BSSL-BM11]|uniref:Multidrug-efflux transporter n=1 Tax=Tianweitania aestuarii TaxID=2814886 RepID=A0ABS5RV82_9HYPH|nr:MATE family efflux transporter [Tianweitania aestuarii]MBS9720966.1 MATE family efflux transporter [Tianweitania aestuarii]
MTSLALPAQSRSSLWRMEIMAMLALAWPMVMTNLGQIAMTTTDVLMVGRLGPDAIAAAALGTSLYFLPTIFGIGLVTATSPMAARELGRNRFAVRETRRTIRQGLWLAILYSVPAWIFLWNAEAIFLLMGQSPELAAGAGAYVRALQWATLPFHAYLVLRSFISALERPGWALVVVAFAIVFNILANWLLIFGHFGFPAMGVPGSGAATTLSSTLMFLGLAAVVAWKAPFRRYHIFGRFWRSDWPRFVALLKLGLPIAAILTFEVSIFNAAAFLIGLIGTDSLAAHAIAMQIASVTFMVPMGLGQAVTVRVGLAFGGEDKAGVTRAGWTAFVMGVLFMGVAALVMIVFPGLLIGAFIDLGDPANARVVDLAIVFLAVAGLFQIVDGAQAVASGMLRGLQDTTIPMIYAAIGYWGIGLPLGALLAFHFNMGGLGIWIGLFAGLAVVAVLLVYRWTRRDTFKPAPLPEDVVVAVH